MALSKLSSSTRMNKCSKQINKYAILIHQLQSEDKDAALSYFSKESIQKVSYSSEGLQIFFKKYEMVLKSIRREKIEVGGLFYKIYPLVTNLTIRGIGPHATDSLIEDIMQDYGFIIDSYRIQETVEHEDYKTVYLTDDYRVILDVPEVVAPSLTPVRLPNVTPKTFEVLFFCRLCRRNGHMQFRCSNARKSSSSITSCQNREVVRKMSYESDSTINCDKNTSSQSNLCVYERSSKIGHDSQIKNKEQDYSSHQKCAKDNFHKNNSSKNCRQEAIHSKPKKRSHKIVNNVNNLNKQQLDSFTSTSVCGSEKFKDNSSSAPKKSSNKILDRRSFHKTNFHQYSGSEGLNERIEASTSNESSSKRTSVNDSKRKKKHFMKFLSKLLPPDADLYDTKKLIQIALKCNPEDIPEEIQAVLLSILQYNLEQKNKRVGKNAMNFLNWINAVLIKIKEKKIRSVKSSKNPTEFRKKEQKYVKDEKLDAKIPKQQPPVKRAITLSLGIKEAISRTAGKRTAGELQPTFLCNFLDQVRGRKNLLEVVSAFTNNISVLAYQLLKVQNTYYKYVKKRGPEENRDISYIKGLRRRLLQHGKNVSQISAEAAMTEVSVKTGPDMTEVPVKTELDMADVIVKTELYMTEVPIKTKSDITEVLYVKSEPEIMEISGKTESDITNTFVERNYNMAEIPIKTESDITEVQYVKSELDVTEIYMKTELDITDTFVERNYDMAESSVKKEAEIFMRQSSKDGPNNLYSANYFTNITQMPFSLDTI